MMIMQTPSVHLCGKYCANTFSFAFTGKDIIAQGRQMLGETQPLASKPGSIRGDYSIDLGRNICHGSDSPESAAHELKMWFPEGVNDWKKTVDSWVYES